MDFDEFSQDASKLYPTYFTKSVCFGSICVSQLDRPKGGSRAGQSWSQTVSL